MGLYEQIRDIAKAKGYSVNRLEKELGFARSSINKFNTNKPSIDKIKQIADFLNVSVSTITGEERTVDYLVRTDEGNEILVEPYYLNDDAREMAQFLFEHPEYKVLFDASRKVSGADIETVKAILDKFRSDDM